MIPSQAIASQELPPAAYLQPVLPPSSLIDYDLGPVGLNDPSQGLSVKLWTFSVIGNEILVGADDAPNDLLFNAEGVTAISGTFDQSGAPQVAFVQGGVARYWWFDTIEGDYVITDLPTGSVTPKMKLDDRRELQDEANDVILAYVLDDNLYFRAQRDRYTVEYLLKESAGGTLLRMGMTTALRFGFDIVPAYDVTGIAFLNAAPDSEVGDTYSHQYQVTGGLPPYTFTVVTGTLPAGITLSTSGLLSGTPTTGGSYAFTVQVVDSNGMGTQLPETVQVSVLAITGTAPGAITGSAYTYTYSASGGTVPYVYSISSGALPAGVTINSTNGTISGTPTTAGAYSWRVAVTDAFGAVATVDDSASITDTLEVSNAAPNIVANVAYSHTYTAAGGTSPYTWALAGTLPTGITWDAGTATVSGTTIALGTYTWTVQVEDAGEVIGTLNESVDVNADQPFIITLANGTVIETTGATIQFRDRPGEQIDLEDMG